MMNIRFFWNLLIGGSWLIQILHSSLRWSIASQQITSDQDDVRLQQLELYLKNKMQEQAALNETNLAQLNDRGITKEKVTSNDNLQYIIPVARNNNNRASSQEIGQRNHLLFHPQQTHRSDGAVTFVDDAINRKAKLTNDIKNHMKGSVIMKDRFMKHHMVPFMPKAPFYLDPLATNCISRSFSRTSFCEDHLIKRLSQDATEGRTVIDVERRVCCALFRHKDCISRIVLETCPDSSPAAADYLLGPSRKLDLTMSCQMFNRDGCNTGLKLIPSYTIPILIVSLHFIMSSLHGDYI